MTEATATKTSEPKTSEPRAPAGSDTPDRSPLSAESTSAPPEPLSGPDTSSEKNLGTHSEANSEPNAEHTTQLNAEPGTEPGRELMVIPKEDRGDGWFMRLLVRIGIRSGGTLRDDLNEALAGEGEAGDVFSPEERAMLQNILRLRERRVEDVMVPRVEIQAVDLSMPLGQVLQRFEETGHSRLPVYEESLDDPRGMVLIKDLLLHMARVSANGNAPNEDGFRDLDLGHVDLSAPLKDVDVIRRLLFVPHSMLASDLMARMQATRTQMALVIDEYGGTDGLVSLEDIVEEVVGEIEDEHDDDDEVDAQIMPVSEGVWEVNARCELDDLREAIGPSFQTEGVGIFPRIPGL
ncbi:MAG: CBS domain-containing protein, partial [Pseudomonadota bacterium]